MLHIKMKTIESRKSKTLLAHTDFKILTTENFFTVLILTESKQINNLKHDATDQDCAIDLIAQSMQTFVSS